MSPELSRAAWRNHSHGNAQFLKPTPRTCRQAFGSSLPHHRHRQDGWVLILAIIGLGMVLALS
jgi:hypothetical protein